MWIVRLALRRPYTFVVAAILVAIFGVVTIERTSTDVFPNINIPVVAVAFNYTGMSPTDMEQRIVNGFERILTTTVNDIEHIESQSLYGIGVVKIYLQKDASLDKAVAQIAAVSQTAIRQMPEGTQPPLIIQYNASDVPIIQLALSSDTIPEQELFDIAINQMRPQLITLPGVQIPYPYGGKQRQVMVDLDPEQLYARGISPSDVSNAISNQNLILPAGTAKIGKQEYQVALNASPEAVQELNDLPIKSVNDPNGTSTTVYIKDVGHVRDGFQVQTNIVHCDGKRAILVSILKSGKASTIDVVNEVNKALPQIKQSLPPGLKITPLFDQSVFVRASVNEVMREALIAAGLTALMILVFLGSWRSTIIVVISIPLSIIVSIICLSLLGQTLNTMTLGGMALAIGILVDDATVEIENIHRNLHQRKRLVKAILDGASQIAVPAFVSTICICVVFVPVIFITGAAKYLFTPLAGAVVFAMLTSYLLSRTLVPTMVHYLLATEVERYGGKPDPNDPHAIKNREKNEQSKPGPIRRYLQRRTVRLSLIGGLALIIVLLIVLAATGVLKKLPVIGPQLPGVGKWIFAHWLILILATAVIVTLILLLRLIAKHDLLWRFHGWFEGKFDRFRRGYGGMLVWALEHRASVIVGFLLLVVITFILVFPLVGEDFFPTVDAGQIRLHVRCPPGTRVEETERYYAVVEEALKKIIPGEEVDVMLDDMGIPNSSINLALSDETMISPADGEILIALNKKHHPIESYIERIRDQLPRQFPDLIFFFAPADIATQVLNFGIPAPIDIEISGRDAVAAQNEGLARELQTAVAALPGIVDTHLFEVPRTPDIHVDVDRTMASQLGLQQRNVASDLLVSLSSSTQTQPNYWFSKQSGVNYNILVQTPQYRNDTLSDLVNTPIVTSGSAGNSASSSTISASPFAPDSTQLLGNLAEIRRSVTPTNIFHYNISPTYSIQVNVQDSDLGSASKAVQKLVDQYRGRLPKGAKIAVRGQVESMRTSFSALGFGMIFAVLLVYCLMAINFQSWLDPLIILMALPGAAAGILWMLFATRTTLSVPSLMGAIMSIGVATSNSILMITFANDQRLDQDGRDKLSAHDAALSAGITRLRPVLMTALAMIIGMLPMSLGLGEGGEQNAPLGRAVIGGLSLATVATLFFVPVVYSLMRKKPLAKPIEPELRD
jgi:multidrug efflux pump subunit AcrB